VRALRHLSPSIAPKGKFLAVDLTVSQACERERACLAHLEEAKKLGVSFSQYCRDKQISMHPFA
jgi:hypothetical protein